MQSLRYTLQHPKIEQLCNFWDIAVGLLGKRGTILEMIDYFIKYQDLILSEHVEEVLKMDFTKDIKPGTRDETTKIIVKLIDTFKSSWYKANTVNQVHIKTYIKLTTKSIRMKQIVTEINNT